MRRVRTTLLFLSVALGSAAAVWLGLAALAGYVASTPAAPSPPPQESGEAAAPARETMRAVDELDLDDEADGNADDVDGNAEDARAHAQMLALRGQASRPARESVGPQGGGAAAPSGPVAAPPLQPQFLSQFRGVTWSAPTQSWQAALDPPAGGTEPPAPLGLFEDERDAAYAVDEGRRRRGGGHAPAWQLNFPPTESGFRADTELVQPRRECARVPESTPLRRPAAGEQLSADFCAFMPLARPEPYLSHQLALLTDVILALNASLAASAAAAGRPVRLPVMPWAGTLLGAHRDGDLIPWTSDADVAIPSALMEQLQLPDSAAVRSLLEKGIITFRAGKTQRFCYHERAPRYDDCPGRWGVCHGGSFIAHSATVTYVDGYRSRIDGSAAAGIGRQVSVEHHARLGRCVVAQDLLPTTKAGAPATVSIRDKTFVAPSATEKIVTALYGWSWREKDPRQRGGGSAGERGDVCSWPHRSASHSAAPQGNEEAATADAPESEASDLFASLGGEAAARQAHKSKGKPGRGRGRGAAEHGRAERQPLTNQQMTDILLG